MTMPTFSPWLHWDSRASCEHRDGAGTYLLARFEEEPPDVVDPLDQQILLIAETHGQNPPEAVGPVRLLGLQRRQWSCRRMHLPLTVRQRSGHIHTPVAVRLRYLSSPEFHRRPRVRAGSEESVARRLPGPIRITPVLQRPRTGRELGGRRRSGRVRESHVTGTCGSGRRAGGAIQSVVPLGRAE